MKGNGLIGLDRTTTIEAKLDAIMNKLSSNEKRMHIVHEVGAVREGRRNNDEGYEEEEPYQVEEAQYLNANKSFTFKSNPNLPTHYSPALRNHESFSYDGGAKQGSRHRQNYHKVYTQPRFQQQQQQQHKQNRDNRGEYQGQKRIQTFEDQVLQFMIENKRILNVHDFFFAELENFQANTTVFQININSTLRNLETQVRQLALSLQRQSKNTFPSSIEINPKYFTPTAMRGSNELKGSKKM